MSRRGEAPPAENAARLPPRQWAAARALASRVAVVAAIALVLAWVPLLSGLQFPPRHDELNFHLPVVRRFADHFPTFDELRRPYLSFLPLFHGVMGLATRLVGTSDPALRALMIPIGLAAMVIYGWIAGRRLGLDWRTAALTLAVFPYFGATYFTVLTDFPAFLAMLIGLMGQLAYLRTRRAGAMWLAALGGLAACLVRQNLIFSPAVFVVLLLLPAGRGSPPPVPGDGNRRHGLVRLLPLALPFAAVALEIWMWNGPMPPHFMNVEGYVDRSLPNWLLNLLSLAANTGYYLLPASAALALADRRSTGGKTWVVLIGASIAGALTCLAIQGPNLLGVFGTFRHVLEILASRMGYPASFLMLVASLLSFGWVVRYAAAWVARAPRGDLRPALVVATLAGGYLVLGYGLSKIYERHLLPLFALAVFALLGGTSPALAGGRTARIGWAAAILFGLAHSVAYSLGVYELPLRTLASR